MSEVVTSTPKRSLLAKVLAILNLTDEGRIDNFFSKQTDVLVREKRDLNTNKSTLINQRDQKLEDLNEQLEDAQNDVDSAYAAVKPENVATNDAAKKFAVEYWDNIESAEEKVANIQKQIKSLTESYAEQISDLDAQLVERDRRIARLS